MEPAHHVPPHRLHGSTLPPCRDEPGNLRSATLKQPRLHLPILFTTAVLVAVLMPFLPADVRVGAGSALIVVAGAAVLMLEPGPHLYWLLGLVGVLAPAQLLLAAVREGPHPEGLLATPVVAALAVQTVILWLGSLLFLVARRVLVRREQLIEDKDHLIASISHQLRTPLTAVIGFAELLRTGPERSSPEERRAMISDLSSHAFELSGLIDDLLVASRAELEDLEVVSVPVSLRSQLAQELEVWNRDDNVPQRVEVVGEAPKVQGDPGRIRQILHNLIANALRHGGERIRIRLDSDGVSGLVAVADDGPPIPPEVADSLFEPYRRATPSLTPGPLGLGLSVARHLSQLMGGDLSYARVDGWTELRLTLPLADQGRSHQPPAGEGTMATRSDLLP